MGQEHIMLDCGTCAGSPVLDVAGGDAKSVATLFFVRNAMRRAVLR